MRILATTALALITAAGAMGVSSSDAEARRWHRHNGAAIGLGIAGAVIGGLALRRYYDDPYYYSYYDDRPYYYSSRRYYRPYYGSVYGWRGGNWGHRNHFRHRTWGHRGHGWAGRPRHRHR